MTGANKTVLLGELFDEKDLATVLEIRRTDERNFHTRCVQEIIMPKLAAIKAKHGQIDPGYLAYALEFGLNEAGH